LNALLKSIRRSFAPNGPTFLGSSVAVGLTLKGLRYTAEHPVEVEGDNHTTLSSLKSIRNQLYLNIALVHLKAQQYPDTIKAATRVLELTPLTDGERAKALYRRGVAYGKTREEDLAVADLKAALELNPKDAGVVAELNVVRNRVKTRREKEKAAFSKMFS
jgi:peptidyl-prolyl isomerase D